MPTTSPSENGVLEEAYNSLVNHGHIIHDSVQYMALQHLQNLLSNLLDHINYLKKPSFIKFFIAAPSQCRHLYLYGDVGRGKSMLMDLFYQACPIKEKRRVHFHAFMLEAHEFIHQWQQQNKPDVVDALARHIRASSLLLCFDEFHVSDIADAMLLDRLFSRLFNMGVIVVMTSNRHPNELYQGGLQRELFLPFIRRLEKSSDVIKLIVHEDYRLKHLHALKTCYFYPLNSKANDFIINSFHTLTQQSKIIPGTLQVLGRKINLIGSHGDIVLSSFSDLCENALGAADYIELANEFSTLILSGIPQLTLDMRDEAKRFVTLIDTLYEHKVKLICSAETPIDRIFLQDDGAFEYKRTISRLIEMQSENYLISQHLPD